jgi:drug/metabolite transporter (DMT)-like permease
LIRKSWIVFLQAITLSFESITVEFLTRIPGISSMLVAAFGIPIAGVVLLFTMILRSQQITVFYSWRLLLAGSVSLAMAVYLWYDSVARVGASKEGLLAGPLETVVVLVLAWLILKEKLKRIQLVGICVALLGFFATVQSGSSDLSVLFPQITYGDLEAIFSAFAFAFGVIVMADLVKKHTPSEVTGASLLMSGLVLVIVFIMSNPSSLPAGQAFLYLTFFSLLPMTAALLYVVGLNRIGASLTSTIASSNILFTLLIQVVLRGIGIESNLPQNIFMATAGGILAILGIYLIHRE